MNQNPQAKNDESVSKQLPAFLKQETAQMLWSPIVPKSFGSSDKKKVKWDQSDEHHYGMGWGFMPSSKKYEFCKDQRCFISHTGGAMGASSVLLILPRVAKNTKAGVPKENDKNVKCDTPVTLHLPEGVVVSIICNTSGVSLTKLALDVAKVFETLRPTTEGPYRVQKLYLC